MPSTSYIIHEGAHRIEADVRYSVHPASGDGRWEPFEPASVEVIDAKLVKYESVYRRIDGELKRIVERTELGAAPAWVIDLLEADEDWQNEILADYHSKPEYEREVY